MAKDIPRSTLRQLVRDYKSNGLFQTKGHNTALRSSSLLAYNNSGSVISAGSGVVIYGFAGELSYTDAVNKLLDGELVVKVERTTSNTAAYEIAIPYSPIPARGIGTIVSDGIFFAKIIYVAPASGEEEYDNVSSDFRLVKSGAYKVLARSNKNSSNEMICAIARKSGGNSGIVKSVMLSSELVKERVSTGYSGFKYYRDRSTITGEGNELQQVITDVSVDSDGSLVFKTGTLAETSTLEDASSSTTVQVDIPKQLNNFFTNVYAPEQ